MRKRILGWLLAGQALAQTPSNTTVEDSIFQSHRYMIDWEDWPSYFIEAPSVAVCYHKQEVDFLSCVDSCASKSGRSPRPIDPDCDMIGIYPVPLPSRERFWFFC
jgi:hypothetical protein